MAMETSGVTPEDKPIEQQAREQTGQGQVRLQIDERNMQSCYANAFRTNGTPEEVILDFGLNLLSPAPGPQNEPQIMFQVTHRVILNYFSAKRLALTLGQLIRQHEDQFGQIELDVTRRQQR